MNSSRGVEKKVKGTLVLLGGVGDNVLAHSRHVEASEALARALAVLLGALEGVGVLEDALVGVKLRSLAEVHVPLEEGEAEETARPVVLANDLSDLRDSERGDRGARNDLRAPLVVVRKGAVAMARRGLAVGTEVLVVGIGAT